MCCDADGGGAMCFLVQGSSAVSDAVSSFQISARQNGSANIYFFYSASIRDESHIGYVRSRRLAKCLVRLARFVAGVALDEAEC